MLLSRYIPCLLLKDKGLVKSINFKKYKYIGDPLNAVKIFNEKEADELMFIDIEASKKKKEIDYKLLEKIANQSFMPLCYGGGIKTIQQMKRIFYIGYEKISLNTIALNDLSIVKKASETFGSQSVVITVDIKKNLFGKYQIFSHTKKKVLRIPFLEYIKKVIKNGAGEIVINNVDRDGKMNGFDLKLMRQISDVVDIPIIALGGAGKFQDMTDVIKLSNISAAAAGSLFVYQGPNKAVLINYK